VKSLRRVTASAKAPPVSAANTARATVRGNSASGANATIAGIG